MADKCIRGTMLEFTGKRRWRASKDSSWATVNRAETCGKMVGTRLIDGVRVAVVKTGDGRFYAERVAAPPAPSPVAAPVAAAVPPKPKPGEST